MDICRCIYIYLYIYTCTCFVAINRPINQAYHKKLSTYPFVHLYLHAHTQCICIHIIYMYIYINMYAFMCMFDGTGLRPCTDICVAYMHISHLNAEDIHAPHYRDLFICISSATATCDTAERLQNAQSHGSSNCQG